MAGYYFANITIFEHRQNLLAKASPLHENDMLLDSDAAHSFSHE